MAGGEKDICWRDKDIAMKSDDVFCAIAIVYAIVTLPLFYLEKCSKKDRTLLSSD